MNPGGGTWHRFFYPPTYDVFGVISHANDPASISAPARAYPPPSSSHHPMKARPRRVGILLCFTLLLAPELASAGEIVLPAPAVERDGRIPVTYRAEAGSMSRGTL